MNQTITHKQYQTLIKHHFDTWQIAKNYSQEELPGIGQLLDFLHDTGTPILLEKNSIFMGGVWKLSFMKEPPQELTAEAIAKVKVELSEPELIDVLYVAVHYCLQEGVVISL